MKRRTLLIGLLVPVALVVVLAAVALFAATSTTGLRFAAGLAQPLVPGELEWASLDGRLVGPLRIEGLRWRDGETSVVVAQATIEWQPARLAASHLHFDRIDASGIVIELPPASAEPAPREPGPLRLPELPLTITAEQIAIADLRIVQGESAVPIESIAVAAQVDAKRYRVDSLTIVSAPLDVSGALEFGLDAPHTVAAQLAFEARLEQFGRPATVTGELVANGDLQQLNYELSTTSDLAARVTGVASELMTEATLAGRLDLDAIAPALAGFDTTGASARLEFALDTAVAGVEGRASLPAFVPQPVQLDLQAHHGGDEIEIERLLVAVPGTNTSASASGSIDPRTQRFDLQLDWSAMQWPLAADPIVASARGAATLRGDIERYALELDASVTAAPAPRADVAARASGTTRGVVIERLTARFDEAGDVQARGTVDWDGVTSAQLDLSGTTLSLEQFVPQLSGEVGFEAGVSVSVPPTGARVAVALRELDGTLRGQPLDGRGVLRYAAGELGIEDLQLDAGDARLRANGAVAEQVSLRWTVAVPDLALLLPDAAGSLSSTGTATGPRARPALDGQLRAENLSVATISAARIESDFRLGTEAASPAEMQLDASDVRLGNLSLGRIEARSEGSVGAHTASVALDGETGVLTARARGGLDGQDWRGELQALSLSRPGYGDWTLATPATLAIGVAGVELQRSCLQRADAALCIGGDWSATRPWQGAFSVADLPLAFLAPFLPPGLTYEGALNGSGQVAGDGAALAGTAELQLSPGRIVTRADDEDDILVAFERGTVAAQFDTSGADARIDLDLRDTGLVNASLRVPFASDAALDGNIYARVENLGFLPALLPQVGRVDGRVEAQLAVAGTRSAPDLSGQLALKATTLTLPEFGITLQDVLADIITRDNLLRFQGSARSGDGDVRLEGDLAWQDGAPGGQISLTGERFRAIDLPELWLDATPDVKVTIAGREIRVEGEVAVPAARITPIDIDTGVGVSSDQVIVGEQTVADEEAWRVNGRVRVTAGDAVNLKGYGLQGRLTGSVLIIDRPGQPTIGRGALEVVDGVYKAYGQELEIETGRLEFTGGPIDDPGLDLRATRDTGEVVAGVQVRGALRAPELDIFTVPPQSDTQAMSYLITGRGIEDLNAADQLQVSDAATKLALQGGSLLAASLGRGLGLDSVGLEDEGTTASTSLVIGKHLSPRLFVSYGIGLFDAVNTLRLRYLINSRLTLETESGARNSADLLYSFER